MSKFLTILAGVLLFLFSGTVFSQQSTVNHGQFHRAIVFNATLSGEQEVTEPRGGVKTNLRGRVFAQFDPGFRIMRVHVRFNSGQRIVALHFHCGRAGQNGPLAMGLISPGPLALTGDVVRGRLTNADVLGQDCEALIGQPINNLVSLAAAMEAGLIYINAHTAENPSGEARGQLARFF